MNRPGSLVGLLSEVEQRTGAASSLQTATRKHKTQSPWLVPWPNGLSLARVDCRLALADQRLPALSVFERAQLRQTCPLVMDWLLAHTPDMSARDFHAEQ
jgi:hypothetical protein